MEFQNFPRLTYAVSATLVSVLSFPVLLATHQAYAISPENLSRIHGLSVDYRLELGLRKTVYRDQTGPGTGFINDDTIRFQESEFEFSLGWRDRLRAAVKADLAVLFAYEHKNRIEINDAFRFSRFIENAYVEIGNLEYHSFKLTVGKRNVALGLHHSDDVLPLSYTRPSSNFWNGLQHSRKQGVLGVTAEFVPGDSFSYVDIIGVSVYEDTDGDFDIDGDKIVWQVRIQKHLAGTEIIAAFGLKENDDLSVAAD
ncbi:MAG: hypothetical protein OXI19_00035, partial [Gemmatimonadota bacterium]|nr:hypothetical protein [Gemmatimonadota bacterium]